MPPFVQEYISHVVQVISEIDSIWLIDKPSPDIHLAIVSNCFAGPQYPATVERLYTLLWTMPLPAPSLMLNVLDLDEWRGWRGEDVRRSGKVLYQK